MLYPLSLIGVIVGVAALALLPFFLVLFCGEYVLANAPGGRPVRFLLLIVKSLRRNLLRTSLTYLATFVLVIVVTAIWSVLHYLDNLTRAKTSNVKAIVSEKWQMDSRLPFAYAAGLSEGGAGPSRPGGVRPLDSMTWQFYAGTLDPAHKTRESAVFFIALEPKKILTMLNDILQEVAPDLDRHRIAPTSVEVAALHAAVAQMESNRRAVLVGRDRLKAMNKRVGDRITVTSLNYQDVDLEFEIVGVFPPGRFDGMAAMNRAYLNAALDAYQHRTGAKHPLAEKSLNLVWLKVHDLDAYAKVAEQIESSGEFRNPAVKCGTLSSEVAAALEGYKDLFWAMRWLLTPAILGTMTLVLANAVSLSVRERRAELAVLKVLGYRPVQILFLVLGEAVLIGAVSGFLSALITYVLVDKVVGNLVTIGIYVPEAAFLWGPGVGALTALAGCVFPALTACRVRVSEVFARVA